MKRLLILAVIAMLTACASNKTVVSMQFPGTPDELKTACPDLATVDPTTQKLSDALEVVTANYNQYYLCKDKVDNWLDWYNTQQKIYNSVK
jgi:uncharacterized lipoprotein YajG